jgi:hypothetical protein
MIQYVIWCRAHCSVLYGIIGAPMPLSNVGAPMCLNHKSTDLFAVFSLCAMCFCDLGAVVFFSKLGTYIYIYIYIIESCFYLYICAKMKYMGIRDDLEKRSIMIFNKLSATIEIICIEVVMVNNC